MLNKSSGGVGGDYAFHFAVTEPGRYRLAFPEVEGYEKPDPIEFDMVQGEATELEVRLVAELR